MYNVSVKYIHEDRKGRVYVQTQEKVGNSNVSNDAIGDVKSKRLCNTGTTGS